MQTNLHARAVDMGSAVRLDPARVLSVLRSAVGVGSWASPSITSRVVGLGSFGDDPRAAVITRLFGIRELVLAQGVRHPNPAVRRAVLQASVVVDSMDLVASVIAVRKGAPKVILLTFASGAAFFAGLGLAGLAGEQHALDGDQSAPVGAVDQFAGSA